MAEKSKRKRGGEGVETVPSAETAPGNRRVTLREVAAEAGVSLGMASRVLSDYGYYGPETKRRVQAAARRLGYRPNRLARALRSGRSRAIGVVVSNILSYHWTTFIHAFEAAAAAGGYQVLLGSTGDDPDAERSFLRTLQERNVEGIVLSPSDANEALLKELVESGLALVLIEYHSDGTPAPRINIDDRAAARQAVQHLVDLGHQRIGIVAGSQALASGRERLAGYREALDMAGLRPDEDLVRFGQYEYDLAYQAVEQLLDLPEPPTALLVCNEKMTGAALACLKDRDVSIPGRLSLVGFDDPPWTAFYRPGITTVRTPRADIAELAFRTLLAELAGEASGPAVHLVETEFVVRESTAPPGA